MMSQKEEQRKRLEEQSRQQKIEEQKKLVQAVWSDQDLKILYKASLKYPPGSYNRWEQIANKLNHRFTEEQIAFKCNDLKNLKQAPQKTQNEWSQEQQKQLENALKTVPKNLKPEERWQKIAEQVEGKTMKECVERFKEIQ